jgi:hypothetical protein
VSETIVNYRGNHIGSHLLVYSVTLGTYVANRYLAMALFSYFTAEQYLPSRWLAMDVSFDFDISASAVTS